MRRTLRHLLFHLRLVGERLVHLFSMPLECRPRWDAAERDSPYESLRFEVAGREALICYGSPSVRDRDIFGVLVPYGELWRTGANEPTTLHLPFRARVAGLAVPRGRYSVYTVPGEDRWEVVLNRSTGQSGRTREERGKRGNLFPNAYTDLVRSAELGRATVGARVSDHVERLRFRAEVVDASTTNLVLEWAKTRVEIPLSLADAG